jgi:hypothetical protein
MIISPWSEGGKSPVFGANFGATVAETLGIGNERIGPPPNERVNATVALTTNRPPPISRSYLGIHAALPKPQ